MTQFVRTRYRAPLDPEQMNLQFAGAVQAGVIEGFACVCDLSAASVTIKAGKLWMPDGVLVEENADLAAYFGAEAGRPLTANATAYTRIDTFVCEWWYATNPDKEAVYKIIVGTPGESPTPPAHNNVQIPIAYGLMPAGASAYSAIYRAPRVWRFNHTLEAGVEKVTYGAMTAARILWIPQAIPALSLAAGWRLDVVTAGTLADGATITSWTTAGLFDENGLGQLLSLAAEIIAARGDTTSLNARLSVSLNADGTLAANHSDLADMPDRGAWRATGTVAGLTITSIGGLGTAFNGEVRYDWNSGSPTALLRVGEEDGVAVSLSRTLNRSYLLIGPSNTRWAKIFVVGANLPIATEIEAIVLEVTAAGGQVSDHDPRYLQLADLPPDLGGLPVQWYPPRTEMAAADATLQANITAEQTAREAEALAISGNGVLLGCSLKSDEVVSGPAPYRLLTFYSGKTLLAGKVVTVAGDQTYEFALLGAIDKTIGFNSSGVLVAYETVSFPSTAVPVRRISQDEGGLNYTNRDRRVVVSPPDRINTFRLAQEHADLPATAQTTGGFSLCWAGRLALARIVGRPSADEVEIATTGGTNPFAIGMKVAVQSAAGDFYFREVAWIEADDPVTVVRFTEGGLDSMSDGVLSEYRVLDSSVDFCGRLVSVSGTARQLAADADSLLPGQAGKETNGAALYFNGDPATGQPAGDSVFNAASGYTANGVDWTESAWGLLDKDVGASPLIPLYTEIGESAGGWRLFAKRETAELMIAHGASLITGSGLPGYFAYFLLLLLCGPRLA